MNEITFYFNNNLINKKIINKNCMICKINKIKLKKFKALK